MADSAPSNAASAQASNDPKRRRVLLFIVVVLIAQLLIPLRYYAGISEGDDERFSWRMFSTVRLQRCNVNISEQRKGGEARVPVSLKPIVQVAWISILQRFRPSVVEGFLRFRCQTEGVEHVYYDRQCTLPDGTTLPTDHVEIACDSGVISHPSKAATQRKRGASPLTTDVEAQP